jgi:hypothetical protein
MPGIFEVVAAYPQAIEGILLIAEYSLEGEWERPVRYLPLRWIRPQTSHPTLA